MKQIDHLASFEENSGKRHALPAIGLFFLAPLVAEFVLGDIPIIYIVVLVKHAMLYGGGALLIREVVRRAGYGWPTMMIFALAYGVIEEGFTTFTLFNPNWLVPNMLDYGYIPALGIALPWTLFVLGLHSVWSVSVPIAIMETLAASRRTTPWLGKTGLKVTAMLYVLGLGLVLLGTIVNTKFVASIPQLIGTGIVAAAIIIIGIRVGQRKTITCVKSTRNAPSAWLVGSISLVAGSIFMLIYAADPNGLSPWLANINLPAWLAVSLDLALIAGFTVLVNYWSHLKGWSNSHRFALAGGALLTYVWHSFPWEPLVPNTDVTVDLITNIIFAIGAIVLLAISARQLHRSN
jgi:hypothetical protein